MEITDSILMELQYLGIITGVDSLGRSRELFSISKDNFLVKIKIGKNIITIMNDDVKSRLFLYAYEFTILGMELMKIIQLDKDMEYLEIIITKLRYLGFDVKIE